MPAAGYVRWHAKTENETPAAQWRQSAIKGTDQADRCVDVDAGRDDDCLARRLAANVSAGTKMNFPAEPPCD